MLVDHADAVVKRILRGFDGYRLPVDKDFALVGEVNAAEHIHQRGLATAVFTEQRQDLTLFQCKVNVVIRDDIAETLGNMAQLNGIFAGTRSCCGVGGFFDVVRFQGGHSFS